MLGVTVPPLAVAGLFGERESGEQVNCVVSSMHQAFRLTPIADVSLRPGEPPLRADSRGSSARNERLMERILGALLRAHLGHQRIDFWVGRQPVRSAIQLSKDPRQSAGHPLPS